MKRRLNVMECDAPGCFVTRAERPEDGPPEGIYFGNGHWDNGGAGGSLDSVYACSEEHVTEAVNAVLDRRFRQDW